MNQITFDANELASNTEVIITRISAFRWRVGVSLVFLKLAQWMAPFNIEISKNLGEAWLFYCRFCGRDFQGFFVPGWRAFSVHCYHCNHQNLASSGGGMAWTIDPKDAEPCNYSCEFVEPYGFVPESGCPVHDRY